MAKPITMVTRNTRKQMLVSTVRGKLCKIGELSKVEWNHDTASRRVDLDRLDANSLDSLNLILSAALYELLDTKEA